MMPLALLCLFAQNALPEDFLKTSASLRAYGLGDPSGGTYRSTRQIVPSPGDEGMATEVHGWAFSDGRFVTRQGLTYDGIRQTSPADLESDVAAVERAPGNSDAFARAGRQIEAAVLVSGKRPDLARRLLNATPANDLDKDGQVTQEWFLRLRYGQAVAAHIQGKDREARRAEMGLADAAKEVSKRSNEGYGMIEWLRPEIESLTQDTERRLTVVHPAPPKGKAERLIAELENAKVAQHGLPGRSEFVDSPTVRRLIALGDRAVDPLIDCIDSDRRLTRSASYGQVGGLWVETVDTAARTALFGILGVSVAGSPEKDVTSASLRAYWNAHRRESPAVRALGLLADDTQEPGIWQESAERLFGVRRLPHFYDNPVPVGLGLRLPAKEARVAGLADLLLRRARHFEQGPDREFGYGIHRAARLAAMLTLIDRERGLALLSDLTHEAGELLLKRGSGQPLEEVLASGTIFRADHGDRTVWPDYRAWLTRRREKAVSMYYYRQFAPLTERRQEPALRGASDFFGPGSPWRPLAMAKAGLKPENLFVSPLLALPEVRKGVIELLRDRTPAGNLTVGQYTGLYYVRKDRAWVAAPRPADVPPIGTIVPLRLADLFADRLANLEGAPRYHPWLSEAARDAGISALIRFVEARGDRLYRGSPWGRARP